MKHAFSLVCLLTVLGLTAGGHAQSSPAAPSIVGDRTSSNWKMEANRTIVDTATFTFPSRDGGPVYTIDFITRHLLKEPVPPSGVVDIVVTQRPVEDETPEITLRVDGETVPLVARLHGQRSVVASVSLGELDRIAGAGAVVDRTFNTELEFSPGQARMLRT